MIKKFYKDVKILHLNMQTSLFIAFKYFINVII